MVAVTLASSRRAGRRIVTFSEKPKRAAETEYGIRGLVQTTRGTAYSMNQLMFVWMKQPNIALQNPEQSQTPAHLPF